MSQTKASTPTTESTAIIQKSIASTPSKRSLAIGCNEKSLPTKGAPVKRGCSTLHGAEGYNAAHLRPPVGSGARRDGGGRHGTHTDRGARRKRALRGLGGRLRLRRLSARGCGAGEKRGGGHGHAVFGVGAFVGAGDGRRGIPLRGEVLGGGACARRLRGVYDGVRSVVALRRRRGARLPLGSHLRTS